MKRTLALIVIVILLSMTTIVGVRAQVSGPTVSAVGNWRPGDAHVHSSHSHCPVWDINIIEITRAHYALRTNTKKRDS